MHQPHFFPSTSESGSAMNSDARMSPPAAQPKRPKRRIVLALLAAEFLLAIMVRIFIGVILLVLPWSPLWDNNHLLQAYPHVAALLSYGATRGIVSGIGLLDLWIAVDDTLHRSERHA
jgi:hypothetical protein